MPDSSKNPAEPSAKPVKLRESCDSCLLAKVKCSKSRPLCSRCLSNGAPCDYSPSSRSGKRNRNMTSNGKTINKAQQGMKSASSGLSTTLPPNTAYLTRLMYPLLDEEDRAFLSPITGPLVDGAASPLFQHNVSLKFPFAADMVGVMPNGESIEPADFLPTPPFSNNDHTDPFMSAAASHDNPFHDFTISTSPPPLPMDHLSTTSTWTPKENPYFRLPNVPSPLDLIPISTMQTSHPISRTLSSPPTSSPPSDANLVRPVDEQHHSCDCFAACLQVLQLLHNHSMLLSASNQGSPPFDIVLTINREAMDSCSTMLDCTNCVVKSGRSIATMMLATIFGKVMALYRAACYLRFGSPGDNTHTSAQLAFGAYTVTGENRQLLEIEILLLELRKLDRTLQLYSERFHNTQQAEKDDEAGVYGALTSYLEKNLQHIVEFLQARKGGMQSGT